MAVVEMGIGGIALVVRCWSGMWSGCRWVRRIRRWWSGCGGLCEHAELRGQCALAVDATGVGAPVVEMLRAAGLSCEIEGGDDYGRRAGESDRSGWNVPKQDLIAGVQVLLEQGRAEDSRKLREVGRLVRELMDVRASGGAGKGEAGGGWVRRT